MSRKGVKNIVFHKWTEEEKKYLEEITPGRHYKEIRNLLNDKYNLDLTLSQIKGAISRYKLNTGFTGRFVKNSIPFNKGNKGICAKGCEKTWFKKGNRPINHKPIGSERIDADGYTLIKIAEPNKWALKHRVLWEKVNGKIPKGHNVIFADGDKKNINIDNLILVSWSKLLIMNRNNLIKTDAELTRTGAIIADLYKKINEKSKE